MFFLSSLGYHPKNYSLVISMMGKSNTRPLVPPKDQRGRQAAVNKMDVKTLDDHIEFFHPCVSHYRREHAPNRRYLPSDITIKMMHSDYLDKGNTCSYEAYRKIVKDKKISFAKLGEEQCEDCLEHAEHANCHTGETESSDCPECLRNKHKQSALESRQSYQADAGLFYKLSHTENEFMELDFLMKKFSLKVPTLLRPQNRGVEEVKKRDIICNLCPLMPPNRRVFWYSLPVSNVVEDEE